MRHIYQSLIVLSIVGLFGPANAQEPVAERKVVEQRGGHVKVVKYDDGTWQLLVNGKPYFIQGVISTGVKLGESPHNATMRDWMLYDDDKDGRNDVAFQTWVDENKNNKKDPREKVVGDFKLLKDMGVNTIRFYHMPSDNPILGDTYKTNPSGVLQFDHAVNKELLRKLYKDYGIMSMMGSFAGSWTVGSNADWEKGTDYRDPAQREKIKNSVKAMVLDNKDEPYVLMWVLGNENNIGTWTKSNAFEVPDVYAKFIGELTDMVHQLDPEHPVAVCDADNFNTLKEYAKVAQGIDIMAYNSYRGIGGFGSLWREVQRTFDRPVFISEYGIPAYNSNVGGEFEEQQLQYIRKNEADIRKNGAENKWAEGTGAGNSIGGIVFDWLDRWYMDGSPNVHDLGTRAWGAGDGILHEEWFGILSLGDGSDPLMRRKRKIYDHLADVWNGRK